MELKAALEQYRETRPWARPALASFERCVNLERVAGLEPWMLVAYLEYLIERGCQPRTIHSYRAAINGFFWWLLECGILPFSEAELAEALRDQGYVTPPTGLDKIVGPDEDAVRALLEAAHAAVPAVTPGSPSAHYRYLAYLRNVAMIEVLRATGMRITELVALRRADVESQTQTAIAPDGRRLYFDLESWAALSRYLAARGDAAHYPLLQWNLPLFARHNAASVGQRLQPLSRRSVNRIIAGLSPGTGLGARAFRARFANLVLSATRDEAGTARLLGLRKPGSIRRYAPADD